MPTYDEIASGGTKSGGWSFNSPSLIEVTIDSESTDDKVNSRIVRRSDGILYFFSGNQAHYSQNEHYDTWTEQTAASTLNTARAFSGSQSAVDSNNVVHYAYTSTTNGRICYRQKAGLTWSSEEIVSATTSITRGVQNVLIDSLNNVWVIWRDIAVGADSGLKARKRTGGTWGSIEDITFGGDDSEEAYFADAIIDSDNYIHLFYGGQDLSFNYNLYYRVRTTSWSDRELVVSAEDIDPELTIIVQPRIHMSSGNVLHVCFTTIEGLDSGYFLRYAYKDDSNNWAFTPRIGPTEARVGGDEFGTFDMFMDSNEHLYVLYATFVDTHPMDGHLLVAQIQPSPYGPSISGPHILVTDYSLTAHASDFNSTQYFWIRSHQFPNRLKHGYAIAASQYSGSNFRLKFYYSRDLEWTPAAWNAEGGIVCNGTAVHTKIFQAEAGGGVVCNGTVRYSTNVTQSISGGCVVNSSGVVGTTVFSFGGVVCNGTATSQVLESVEGGVVCNGSDIDTLYSDNIAIGGVVIGGTATIAWITSTEASGGVVCNGSGTLSFVVLALGGVVCNGSGDLSFVVLALGGVVCNGSAIKENILSPELTGGVVVNGSALQNGQLDQIGSGGVVVAGSGLISVIQSEIASGGVVCNGTATISHELIASGGVVCGGSVLENTIAAEVGSGGIVLSGTTTLTIYYAIDGVGGALVNGTGLFLFVAFPPTEGGVVVGGLHLQTFIDYVDAEGGAIAGGLHIHTFYDYVDAEGGVKVGGKGRIEALKQLTNFRTGICRALVSENICDPVIIHELLPPTNDISPTLEESFRTESSEWCLLKNLLSPPPGDPRTETFEDEKDDFQECKEGVLAAIIVTRQRGIVPPPKEDKRKVNRGIAALS